MHAFHSPLDGFHVPLSAAIMPLIISKNTMRYDADQMARAGVFVSIRHDGAFSRTITTGGAREGCMCMCATC